MPGELVEAAAEFVWAVGEAAVEWIGGDKDKGDQPQPVPETLYEERGAPPEDGMSK